MPQWLSYNISAYTCILEYAQILVTGGKFMIFDIEGNPILCSIYNRYYKYILNYLKLRLSCSKSIAKIKKKTPCTGCLNLPCEK